MAEPAVSPGADDDHDDGEEVAESARVVVIDEAGDLLLHIYDAAPGSILHYRVSSAVLSAASPYFRSLLDPEGFSEGAMLKEGLERVKEQYGADCAVVPASALPVIRISDVGHISERSSNEAVVAHFLQILHDNHAEEPLSRMSLNHLAHLAIVADRFAAAELVSGRIRRTDSQVTRTYGIPSRSAHRPDSERAWRQRLLVGYILGIEEWVNTYSYLLIVTGSSLWKAAEDEVQEAGPTGSTGSTGSSSPVASSGDADSYQPMWSHIPGGIEEELFRRRQRILVTLGSLQDHFLRLYCSGQRQCRLGYSSSLQCDSFQLGEMVRFFTRKGVATLRSNIAGADAAPSYSGPIEKVIDGLRECPSYQIDRNHTHCGLRARLVPLLGFVERIALSPLLTGICLRCWQGSKARYSWIEAPVGGRWRFNAGLVPSLEWGCKLKHTGARQVFTAKEWDWTPE